MKDFFLYIQNRIQTRIPDLKVELFNDQFIKADNDRTEKAIKYPICYIEFIVESVNNYAMGFKDYFLRVRFRIGLEGYKFQRLETFDFVDQFYQAVHLMRPTDASGLNFTSFQEVQPEFDEDHRNVDRPYIDYRTKLRTQVTYRQPILAEGIELDLQLEVEHRPLFYEANEFHPVYFYEEAEMKPVFIGE